MAAKAFILILMYWGNDGRSAMTSAEYTSKANCEFARQMAAKEMDGWGLSKTYSVCTPK